MHVFKLMPLALLVSSLPAQIEQTSGMTIEQYEACTGLANTECCEWILRTAGFKVTGDQLPKLTVRAVRLSCAEKEKLATPAVCRGIAFSLRFSAAEVKSLCDEKSVLDRCAKDPDCSRCVADLKKIDYLDPHWACAAVTYKRRGESDEPTVIDLSERTIPPSEPGSTQQEIKRRQQLK